MPVRRKAIDEIGQYIGASIKAKLITKSKIEMIGNAYCKIKK